jgi:macrolide-specific efflux system membrane fusion protein
MTNRVGIWGLFVLLCCAFGAYIFFAWFSKQFSSSDNASYVTESVEQQTLRRTISGFGRLEPIAITEVRQVVAGRIERFELEVGDYVKSGQVVATVNSDLQQLTIAKVGMEVKEAEAVIMEREAELVLRQDIVDRATALSGMGVMTKSNKLERRTELQISTARMEQARAQLDRLRTELEYQKVILGMMELKSPLDGQVLEVFAREGEYLDPELNANQVMTIGKTDVLVLDAMVSEADVLALSPGVVAQVILVSEQAIEIASKIRRIEPMPVTLNGATLYVVELEVENKDNRLRVGMSARVDFVIAERDDALVVPRSAIGRREDAPVVAIPYENGFTVVPVRIGLATRFQQEIVSGLSEGDAVLVPFPES